MVAFGRLVGAIGVRLTASGRRESCRGRRADEIRGTRLAFEIERDGTPTTLAGRQHPVLANGHRQPVRRLRETGRKRPASDGTSEAEVAGVIAHLVDVARWVGLWVGEDRIVARQRDRIRRHRHVSGLGDRFRPLPASECRGRAGVADGRSAAGFQSDVEDTRDRRRRCGQAHTEPAFAVLHLIAIADTQTRTGGSLTPTHRRGRRPVVAADRDACGIGGARKQHCGAEHSPDHDTRVPNAPPIRLRSGRSHAALISAIHDPPGARATGMAPCYEGVWAFA